MWGGECGAPRRGCAVPRPGLQGRERGAYAGEERAQAGGVGVVQAVHVVGGLDAVVAVGGLAAGADEFRVVVGVGGDRQERVVRPVEGDQRLADPAGEGHAGDGPVDVAGAGGVVVVGLLSGVGGVEFLAVDALGEFPVDLVVEWPEEF